MGPGIAGQAWKKTARRGTARQVHLIALSPSVAQAMYAGSPVVAVASGGPLETVKDGQTGFLRPGTPEGFAEAIATMVREPRLKETMGRAGHAHVKGRFGLDAFSATLEEAVRQTVAAGGENGVVQGRGRALLLLLLLWSLAVVGALAALVWAWMWVGGAVLAKE